MLNAVEALLRESVPEHADDLLDSRAFVEALAPLADVDDAELFAEGVQAAVESFLEEDESTEAWDSAAHPRAAAGTATGGQFAAGGGGGSTAGTTPAGTKSSGGGKKKGRTRGAVLAYDPKSNRGPGYGRKGGDPRVRKLQAALNRLGLTDSRGRKLAVDGKLGPLTTQAIKAAQRKLGLPADGKVTPEFLVKLASTKSLPKTAAKKSTKPAAKPTAKKTKEADEVEDTDTIDGRVIEAKGTDESGGRVFRVRIIRFGESRNPRSYPAEVMTAAVPLYEGARAYDHHRTADELRTSTITGLVGSHRNVEAEEDGLYGDLHLLPSATHTGEALDATLAAQEQGLPPLVGISHDVMANYRTVQRGGRRLQEATAITRVHSADVVADPAAGGMATRMVAGGIEETDPEGDVPDGMSTEETDVPLTSEAVLAALQTATPEQLAAVGLSKVEPETQPETTTESVQPTGIEKSSFLGGLMIERKVESAGLPAAVATQLATVLPDRITESDVDDQIAALKSVLGVAERSGLAPTVTTQVTEESREKKVKALDAFFAGKFAEGYHSFRQAFLDITGHRPRSWDEDTNRVILRESFGSGFDSGVRSTESMDTSTWAQVLGDSVTRRMVAEYNTPTLQSWRQIVSSTVPVTDFRAQRIGRLGGYGTLPTVNEGGPYQPLTSPGDEEATYALSKKGGTEDVTLEMIANDDRRAISRIPSKLGRAAAQTLYRDVWDTLADNDTCTFDSTALFHANHANTDSSAALAQTTLSTGRRKMIEQSAYGNTSEILALTPRYIVVPPELEEVAFVLAGSRAVPASNTVGASDQPNIHAGIVPILIPYYTDANDWFLVADPNAVPTLEVGFYNGRQDPELFTQSDNNVGSVFNSDTFTWKIRFIYGVTILDYRGFYRGQG